MGPLWHFLGPLRRDWVFTGSHIYCDGARAGCAVIRHSGSKGLPLRSLCLGGCLRFARPFGLTSGPRLVNAPFGVQACVCRSVGLGPPCRRHACLVAHLPRACGATRSCPLDPLKGHIIGPSRYRTTCVGPGEHIMSYIVWSYIVSLKGPP